MKKRRICLRCGRTEGEVCGMLDDIDICYQCDDLCSEGCLVLECPFNTGLRDAALHGAGIFTLKKP